MQKKHFILLFLSSWTICFSQQKNWNSADIYDGIRKLNVLGSVLYVAAHPDDENTRLITALSKDQQLRTAYISLTRGDGGQNLIGSELDEYLGVIRTNELIEARKIDGGIQYFSRANDFGYSKNAEETYQIWDPKIVQEDLVKVIREFKPDVIINRFDHRTSGKTHGHHTASAIMSLEAFNKQNENTYYPNISQGIEKIDIKRIFFNTSWFFWGSRENFEKADKSNLYSFEVGNYLNGSGYSTTEIAAQSRSMHKSQGFGINSTRGKSLEYLERLDQAKDFNHLTPFDGLDFSWNRIKNGKEISELVNQAIKEYNHLSPELSIPLLQKIEQKIKALEPSHWQKIKLEEVQNLILQCASIYFASHTDVQTTSTSNEIKVNCEIISRANTTVKLKRIHFTPNLFDTTIQTNLKTNEGLLFSKKIVIPNQLQITSPYWLWYGRGNGNYQVDKNLNQCLPINQRELKSRAIVDINGVEYELIKDIYFKNDDPVLGEVTQPLDIIPNVSAIPFDENILLTNSKATAFKFKIKANSNHQSGKISFVSNSSVQITPKEIAYSLEKIGDEKVIEVSIQNQSITNQITDINIQINGKNLFLQRQIKYPHIQWQNINVPAKIRVSSIDLKTKIKPIAYVNGAGDYTVQALEKMNFPVTNISVQDLDKLDAKKFPVLIFGIRALNTNDAILDCKTKLMNYMQSGGRVIMQYNTTAELNTPDFAPSPLKISRDRITDENSPVKINIANHQLLTSPNTIKADDFNAWIQERGLYFPNPYDSTYEEILLMNDPKEKDLKSAILYKKVGKGDFIYTPISWFRQLPKGIPGAYRIFANLVSK